MKYLKTTVYEFILILIFTLIYTILYYFNITSNSFNNALKIISFILIFVLTGIRIGRLSNKKGWLEGLKMAFITIVIFLGLSLLFKYKINVKEIIYYLITIVTLVLSSKIYFLFFSYLLKNSSLYSNILSFLIASLKSSVSLIKNLILCIESNLPASCSFATNKCLIYALV